MARWLIVFSVWLVLAPPAIANACDDSEYRSHLSRLQKLVPAVSGESPSPSSLSNFFDALPSDFQCFNRIFGYNGGPAPLYSEPQLYPLFPKMRGVVDREKYAKKLVLLSVNARWEADQTGALQDAVRSTLAEDTSLFIRLASQLSAEQESSAWWFLFSDIHPQPLTPELQQAVCEASERSCELSKQAYARAQAEEHNH